MRRLVTLTTIAALTSASLLAGCGIRGDLKTPPPLWGDVDKAPPPESTKDRRRDRDDDSYPELGSDFDLEDDDI